tara:strand:+ start:60530 stop:60955 length:426 start_codon:yes stop_codon:yes gene_type:complete
MLIERKLPVSDLVAELEAGGQHRAEIVDIARVVGLIYIPTDTEVRALVSDKKSTVYGEPVTRTFLIGPHPDNTSEVVFIGDPLNEGYPHGKGYSFVTNGPVYFDRKEGGGYSKLYFKGNDVFASTSMPIELLVENPNLRIV